MGHIGSKVKYSYPSLLQPKLFEELSGVFYPFAGSYVARDVFAVIFKTSEDNHPIGSLFKRPQQIDKINPAGARDTDDVKSFGEDKVHFPR